MDKRGRALDVIDEGEPAQPHTVYVVRDFCCCAFDRLVWAACICIHKKENKLYVCVCVAVHATSIHF